MITKEMIGAYLANIIRISQLDGELDPREQAALEKICQRLEATESDLVEAFRKASEDGYAVSPVGTFSDRVRNFEDMLFVSMIDGDLAPEEKQPMLAFAKAIDLTQEQVKIILCETKLKISLRQAAASVCPGCGAALAPDAKFCTACGARIE